MIVGRRTDQLRVDVNRIAGLLHAALQDVGHAKLLCNFAQVVRFTLQLLSRGTRNDFQRPDLGQARQDFILNSGGEISVLFFVAQIFKGQDRNRFTRNVAR